MAIKINHAKVVTANDSASDAAAGRALKADWNADLLIAPASFATDTDIANGTDEYLLVKPSQIKQAIDDLESASLDRSNHTGEQAISTVTGLQTALDSKQATVTNATNPDIIAGTSTTPMLSSPEQLKLAAETHTRNTLVPKTQVEASDPIDLSDIDGISVTLTGNLTVGLLQNPVEGEIYYFKFKQDVSGNRTITMPSQVLGTIPLGAGSLELLNSYLYINNFYYPLSSSGWLAAGAIPTSDLTINDVTVTKGVDSNAVFTVTRSGITANSVDITFQTLTMSAAFDGYVLNNAAAGTDYTTTSGSITFASGELTKTISVPILTPAGTDPIKVFAVALTNVMGAAFTKALGIAQIQSAIVPTTAYKYWRVRITASGGANPSLSEVEMFTTIGGSNICTGGTPISSSDYGAGQVKANAFDGNPTNVWTANTTAPAWIGYDFAAPVIVRQYAILSRSDGVTNHVYSPESHFLEYSSDGVSWTVADARVSSQPWAYLQKRIYTLGVSKFKVPINSSNKTIQQNFLGLHDNTRVSSAADAGISYASYRTHDAALSWDKIETSDNVFDWIGSGFDAMVNAHEARGATIMFTLFGCPVHCVEPTWLSSFTNIARSTVYTASNTTAYKLTGTNLLYICTQSGTSAASAPSYVHTYVGNAITGANQRGLTSGPSVITDGTAKFQILGDPYGIPMNAAPADPAKVQRFITAMLTQYNSTTKRIFAIELGTNEPNLNPAKAAFTDFYWDLAQRLVNMSKGAYDAIMAWPLARRPTRISPGFLNNSNFFWGAKQWLQIQDTYSSPPKYGWEMIEIAAWHPYENAKDLSEGPAGAFQFARWGDFGIEAYSRELALYGVGNMPLCVSEWGWVASGVSAPFQAGTPLSRRRRLERWVAVHAAHPLMHSVYIYGYNFMNAGNLTNTATYGYAFDPNGSRAAFNNCNWFNGKTISPSYQYEDGAVEIIYNSQSYWFGSYLPT